jgi:hypothetical protein
MALDVMGLLLEKRMNRDHKLEGEIGRYKRRAVGSIDRAFLEC